ncbi:MAG: zinc ribbon domain-containing protein [Ignavibacteriales bacterium]|nr:zinc ribbon domain-containing protein [Ignavibacteriales bacterium]
MALKRIATQDGEVYFVDSKTGNRVLTGMEKHKPYSQVVTKKKTCSNCGSEISNTDLKCPQCNFDLPQKSVGPKKFKELTAEDFPGVDPEKFDEWKEAVLEADKNIIMVFVGLLVLNVILFLAMGSFMLGGILLVIVLIMVNRKPNRLAKELGITRDAIKRARAGGS